ncbi:BrnA antitoxin family protein [Herbaspirillum sp. CF444]
MRVDEDVLEAFKNEGEGWQTRMNDALRQWGQEHRR